MTSPECINHRVAALLNKLHIGQFTKSRARQCDDNALEEGKNGAVIRHYLGYDHIPQRFAARVNAFTQEVLSPYLNYHRPCLFATERRDAKGRIRRHYRVQDATTPYEKLKSLPDPARWLAGLGALPMYLGLDLRGGVHFLMKMDLAGAVRQAEQRYAGDLRTLLREEKLRQHAITVARTAG